MCTAVSPEVHVRPFSIAFTPSEEFPAIAAQSADELPVIVSSAPLSSFLPSVTSYFVMLMSEISSVIVITSPFEVTLSPSVETVTFSSPPSSLISNVNSETTLYPSGAAVSLRE